MRTDVPAAHGHDDIRPGGVGVRLELPRPPAREVDPELVHRLHDLRMELAASLAPRRTNLVPAVSLEARVRHLGAALVADAEEEDVHGS